MNTNSNKAGLDALLTPENSVLVLIDHQPFQFANTRNMDPTMILNNTIGLAKAAKAFKVPTILLPSSRIAAATFRRRFRLYFPINCRLIARRSIRGRIHAWSNS